MIVAHIMLLYNFFTRVHIYKCSQFNLSIDISYYAFIYFSSHMYINRCDQFDSDIDVCTRKNDRIKGFN